MCCYVQNMFIRTCSEILGILYDLSDFQQQFIFSLNMFVRLVYHSLISVLVMDIGLSNVLLENVRPANVFASCFISFRRRAQPNQIDPGVRGPVRAPFPVMPSRPF